MNQALTTARIVADHFANSAYLKDEEKIKAIRLNLNFIEQYPEFFTFVMNGPRDVVFGHVVIAKTEALRTVYNLGVLSDEDAKVVNSFNPIDAFAELACHWRLLRAQKKTVIPFVPIESVLATDPNSFSPTLAFKTRYGIIEGTR